MQQGQIEHVVEGECRESLRDLWRCRTHLSKSLGIAVQFQYSDKQNNRNSCDTAVHVNFASTVTKVGREPVVNSERGVRSVCIISTYAQRRNISSIAYMIPINVD
jgi:hypothetical protein